MYRGVCTSTPKILFKVLLPQFNLGVALTALEVRSMLQPGVDGVPQSCSESGQAYAMTIQYGYVRAPKLLRPPVMLLSWF